LFLNSKFMLSWRLQPTSLSPCLFWVLKVFCVFCLAFVVASYNLGACDCQDYACNLVCAWFFFLVCFFLSISHHMSHLCGSLFLGHLFFHMLQHLAIDLQLYRLLKLHLLKINWSHPSKISLCKKNFMKLTRPLSHLIWVYEVPLGWIYGRFKSQSFIGDMQGL